MAVQLVSIIPWVLMALIVAFLIRRTQKSQKYEMDRRVARARVPVTWTPGWVSVLAGAYFLAYGLYVYLDREIIMNVAMLFNVSAISYLHFYVRPKRKREFEARLRACHDRICPQCLYSLEDGRPEGTCPECGTAYTDEGLHAAWAFLHYDEVTKQFSANTPDDRSNNGISP